MRESKDLQSLFASFREPQHFGRATSRENWRNPSNRNNVNEDPFVCLNIVQISTLEQGFNSGRTYYLKAESKEECDSISAELGCKACSARRKAEGKSRFIRSQDSVRKFYSSKPFQILSAVLIITVRIITAFLLLLPSRHLPTHPQLTATLTSEQSSRAPSRLESVREPSRSFERLRDCSCAFAAPS